MALDLGELVVKLKLEGSEYKKGMDDAKKSAGRLGDSFGPFTTAAKIGAGAIAAVGAAAIGAGWNRLMSLDQVETKLDALGFSGQEVAGIMENALAAVDGTAYGIADAASLATQALAAGIQPGDELTQVLKNTADVASIAGISMDEMGAISAKVWAGQKVGTQEMNQLADRGIDVWSRMADHFGVTVEELRKMVSAGEVSADDWNAVMETFDGAAVTMGGSMEGTMSNIWASLGRIGAGMLEEVFPMFQEGAEGMLDAMKGLEPIAKDVGKAIGEFFTWISENSHWLGPLAAGIGAAAVAVGLITAATWLWNAALAVSPVTWITLAIGLLIGAIIALVMNWDEVVAWIGEVWDGFVSWITGITEGLVDWWLGVWEGFVSWTNDLWDGLVSFITDVWDGFISWINDIVDGFVQGWEATWEAVGEFFTSLWDGFVSFVRFLWENSFIGWLINTLVMIVSNWDAIWTAVGDTIRSIWDGFVSWIRGVWSGFIGWIEGVLDGFNSFWAGIWDTVSTTVRDIWDGIIAWFQGIPDAIFDVFNGAATWLYNIGRDIVQGLWNGLKSIWQSVSGWFEDTFGGIIDTVAGIFGTASPSKVFHQFGLDIGQGLINGLEKITPAVDDEFEDMLDVPTDTGFSNGSKIAHGASTHTEKHVHVHMAEHQSLGSEEALFAALGSPRVKDI